MVECHLAKVDVEGSNPFSRSKKTAKSKPVEVAASPAFSFGAAAHARCHPRIPTSRVVPLGGPTGSYQASTASFLNFQRRQTR